MTSSNLTAEAKKFRLAVLLLAAGEGSRLGAHPKALLRKDDQTLLQRFSIAIQAFSPVDYVVVTGFHAQAIESEITRINTFLTSPIRVVRNATPEQGQPSSVRLGLESLRNQFDVLLIALSDQPDITGLEIGALLDRFLSLDSEEEVIVPVVGGKRGNPALLSCVAVQAILSEPGLTPRAYMDRNPSLVHFLEIDNQAYVLDIDTPADIQHHQLKIS